MFDVSFSNQAYNFLGKSDRILAKRLMNKINNLKSEPVGHDSKFIIGMKLFRVRVGDYRILYEVKYSDNLIIIDKIDKRSKVYE